jgi:hypothetical protein
MRALVVVESMFGNTRKVAEAVGKRLAADMTAEVVVDVGVAGTVLDDDVGLLVVGAPTQGHGLSRQAARRAQGLPGSAGPGLRAWLAALQPRRGLMAAAFDTRFDKPRWLTGSAAVAAERILLRRGCRLVAPAESFFVAATKGPLLDGELDRAGDWATRLVTQVRTADQAEPRPGRDDRLPRQGPIGPVSTETAARGSTTQVNGRRAGREQPR